MWKEAYLVSREGAVDPLPDMISARCWHGVIEVHHSVYVFGGAGKLHADKCIAYAGDCTFQTVAGMIYSALKECEKIDLNSSSRIWKDLPAMREEKSLFNPCEWGEFLYLCAAIRS